MGFYLDHGRESKAFKIDAVLRDFLQQDSIKEKTIIDVGCGGGGIASFFSDKNTVYGADTENRLLNSIGKVNFVCVDSSMLPLNDNTFDLVIDNHVIEHVEDQRTHLQEIARVLKRMGVCYCATPNWNFLVEPHYQIPLIHYLPRSLFHQILRLLGIYKEDLFLLSHRQMVRLFRSEGFEVTEYTGKVLKDPDRFHLGLRFTRFIPAWMLSLLMPLAPTNIFVLRKGA